MVEVDLVVLDEWGCALWDYFGVSGLCFFGL